MESYLSHISAAHAWDIPYLHVVLGYSSSDQLLEESQVKEQRRSLEPSTRIQTASVENHYKILPLPTGAIVRRSSELIASPELIFLDLAQHLGFHRAVLLGMQLCASGPGRRKPLTTVKKLQVFLDKCSGHHGRKAAIQAIRYVADNSWSVMESLLYMLLTLPHQYGGYGLRGAVLNHEIKIKEKRDGKAQLLFADLFWEQAKLIVEYDSYEFHNNLNAWMKDARRITALERKGYRTFSVNTAQIYSDSEIRESAFVIAKSLGRRIQIRTPQFAEQKALLRGLLPRRKP